MEDSREQRPAGRYRFGVFEADAATGELRRKGIRVRLNAQPFQLLLLLLDRPGELITRDEISRELWPDGTFVDFDHGVNSAINRIREALGDSAGNPRFVETLARRGYRLVAPVERIAGDNKALSPSGVQDQPAAANHTAVHSDAEPEFQSRILASPHELPIVSVRVVETLFVLLQLMYAGFYVGALTNLGEIEDLLSPLPRAQQVNFLLVMTAAILIPVRAFLLTGVFFGVPGMRRNFLRMWPFLLILDELWSLSPFLLLHHINFGLALACTTLLVYSPFAQRSLVLMGAYERGSKRLPE
jgi:DNA-binding winged helix-turn-helix (wHTH) protein